MTNQETIEKKHGGGLVCTLPRTPPDWDKIQPHSLEWVVVGWLKLGLEWCLKLG